MTSGQDVSEYLDTLGLVRSYFSIFEGEKKNVLVLRCSDAPEDQSICLFAGLLPNPDMPLSLINSFACGLLETVFLSAIMCSCNLFSTKRKMDTFPCSW
jgi:hypothetical protein